MSNLVIRAITGTVLVLLVISTVAWHPYAFSVLFLCISILGIYEFFGLVESQRISPNKIIGTIAGAFLFISNALIALQLAPVQILLFNFLFVFLVFLLELYRKKENPFTNVAFTFFGLLYVSVPFALLNYFPNPKFLADTYDYSILLGFFFLIWVNESGAYLVGVNMGKNKLFERVSPKKTWEGTIGGGILCLTTAFILSRFYYSLDVIDWLIMGSLVFVFSTYGDLFESLLKRSINAKDSGSLLPGHGGILDRFDGVLMATPFVFVYILWIMS